MTITYSRGSDKYDNAPVLHTVPSFKAFRDAVLSDRGKTKGQQYIAAPCKVGPHPSKPQKFPGEKGWRVAQYVQPRCWFPLDMDGCPSAAAFEALREACNGGSCFIYTTGNHTEESPRARLIFELTRPVDREEGIILGKVFEARIAEHLSEHDFVFDANVHRGEQPIYLPLQDTETFVFDGQPLDVDKFLQAYQGVTTAASCSFELTEVESDRTDEEVIAEVKRLAKYRGLWGGEWQDAYPSQSEADYALLGRLCGLTCSNEQVRRLFRESVLGQRDKAQRGDYLDRMLKKIRNREAELDSVKYSESFKNGLYWNTPPVGTPQWPDPEPLPDGIPDVPEFDAALLPDSLRPWITDIAERMQCPLDYPAIALMVALSSVVGRQVTIRPQEQDDWTVVSNLWGAIIGPPGAMKSPPMKEVLKPIEALEKAARERYKRDLTTYEAKLKVAKQAEKKADRDIKNALDEGDEKGAVEIAVQAKQGFPRVPIRQRYLTQDPTVEKLGELLAGNPNGILVYRDELVGWLRSLEKQGHESARAFYLEAWDGNGRFTVDRIGRGTVEIEAATVSILGGIQPGPLTAYLTSALKGGAGDDGLLQRFQLAVWPDQSKIWTPVDRKPDLEARQRAFELFQRLSALDLIEAQRDIGAPLPYLRFDPDAQAVFKEWRQRLELRLRTGEETPAFEGVLSKQRSLLPSLALLIHLADDPEGGAVSHAALQKAVGWVEYLEGHASRIYAMALDVETTAVRALVERIQVGGLGREFTERDVYKKHWKELDRESTRKAIAWLVEADWLWEQIVKTGGRPAALYHVNPKVLK